MNDDIENNSSLNAADAGDSLEQDTVMAQTTDTDSPAMTPTGTTVGGDALAATSDKEILAGAGDVKVATVVESSRPVSGDNKKSGLSRQERLRRAAGKSESSELRNARAGVAAAGVQLTAREQNIIALDAENDEERQWLHQQAEADKLRQLAMQEAKSRVNRAVPAEVLTNRPTFGQIRGVIKYHVRDTYAFLLGRNVEGKYHISGLFEGAQAVRQVVQGYLANCPYAAWYLTRIEDEMAAFRKLANEVRDEIDALVRISTSVEMQPFESKRPAEVFLIFPVRYGFHFADILKLFDDNLRVLRAYERAGFISRTEYKAMRERMAPSLRRLFSLPTIWRFVGKDAVLQQTATLMSAEHRMGTLPEEFLEGKRRPKLVETPRSDDE